MSNESDLRGLFQEARQADEASAPAFDKVRERARMRHPSQTRGVALAALAAVLGLVGLAVMLLQRPEPESARTGDATVGRKAVSLSEWEAPTDFLLDIPGRELLQSTPPIGADVLNFSDVETQRNKKGADL